MYNGVKVLDVHSHVVRPNTTYLFATSMLASNSASPSPLSSGKGRDPAKEEDYEAEANKHVKYLDERNIDVQVLGPQPFLMFGWMPEHLFPSWTMYFNDCIQKEISYYPDRFLGACQLPQNAHAEDTRHCLPELERCVKDYGFGAVYVSPDPTGFRDSPGLAEPYWYPLYERCQEWNLPIIIHGSSCQDPRIRNIRGNYQIGFVIEQYIATEIYQQTDVFDRFPGLKVIICHCGGALNRFLAEDRGLDKDLSNNLFFDTDAHDPWYLAAAIHQRGVPQMVFGTEARTNNPGAGHPPAGRPGISGDDLVPLIASYDFLTEDDKMAIFSTNPIKAVPGLAKF
jgi:predicted TIM-barrel fold metal-dependent hydrolase